jgi:hypothetical protein
MTFRIALVAAASMLVACGGGESAPNDSSAAAAVPPTPNVVTVTAADFAFQAPDTIPAGVTEIRLVNQGPNLHHAQLVRLEQGKTFDDLMVALKAMKPNEGPPAWITMAGGPNAPQVSETSTLIQTLEPGNYALLCFVDIPDHVPHVAKGMVKALTVVPASTPSTAVAPVADVTMQLVDYAFNTTPALTAGRHVIKIENAAQQGHEVFIAQLASGKTVADVEKWMESMQGAPPLKPMGGVAFMAPGTSVLMPVDLPAGNYMLICFVPDAKDGKPHFMKGMVTEIKVS